MPENKETRTPSEITPPNKHLTRSQTQRSQQNKRENSAPTARNLTDIVDLTGEDNGTSDVMSKTALDLEAANVKNLADMAKFFQGRFDALPTKEFMNQRLTGIEQKAHETAENLRELEKRVEKIKQSETSTTGNVIAAGRLPAGDNQTAMKREDAFLRAIRSLRIWPIKGDSSHELTAAVDDFLKSALIMDQRDLNQVVYEDVYRVRSSPWSRQHEEVCVLFRESETRELVLSYARNLATYVDEAGSPTAGMRLEIPPHLLMTHKLLEMYDHNDSDSTRSRKTITRLWLLT